jgi:hypothetical protein
MLMALYIVAMNWGCVIVSMRNRRNGIDKYHSTVPLVSLIIAYFSYVTYPNKPASWIGLIPALDIGNWYLLWLPVVFWREFNEKRNTEPSDPSNPHSPSAQGADGR